MVLIQRVVVLYIYIAYDKVVSPYSIALLMLRYPLIKLIYEMDSLFGKYGCSLGFSLLPMCLM